MAQAAGIVLAGGRSSRMGTPKAALEWHGSTLLRRVVGSSGASVDGPVVVVRAPGQPLPDAARRGRGRRRRRARAAGRCRGSPPGWPPSRDRAPTPPASSTDLPFLHPRVRPPRARRARRRRRRRRCRTSAATRQPLAAAYRDRAGRRRRAPHRRGPDAPGVPVRGVPRAPPGRGALLADPALAALDPDLDSVLNLNEPADYEAARARPAPEVTVRRFGVLRRIGAAAATRASCAAATLGEAAAARRAGARRARRRRAQRRPDHARRRDAARRGRHGRRSCRRTPAADARAVP